MKVNGIYIAGAASVFPDRIRVADAVSAGLVTPAAAKKSKLVSVSVQPDTGIPPEEMAVDAARIAMGQAGVNPCDITTVLHASAFDGAPLHLRNEAAYIQHRLGITTGLGTGIRALCGGGMHALELGIDRLMARGGAALLTTADMWPQPLIDRWHTMPGHALSDGGTALVLTTDRAAARAELRSIATTSTPSLAGMLTAGETFTPGNFSAIDIRKRGCAFRDTTPQPEIDLRRDHGLQTAVNEAMNDAGLSAQDIDQVAGSFLGRGLFDREFIRPLAELRISEDKMFLLWAFGASIGHLGAGDPFAALAYLTEMAHAPLNALVAVAGGGYTHTVAAVTISPKGTA